MSARGRKSNGEAISPNASKPPAPGGGGTKGGSNKRRSGSSNVTAAANAVSDSLAQVAVDPPGQCAPAAQPQQPAAQRPQDDQFCSPHAVVELFKAIPPGLHLPPKSSPSQSSPAPQVELQVNETPDAAEPAAHDEPEPEPTVQVPADALLIETPTTLASPEAHAPPPVPVPGEAAATGTMAPSSSSGTITQVSGGVLAEAAEFSTLASIPALSAPPSPPPPLMAAPEPPQAAAPVTEPTEPTPPAPAAEPSEPKPLQSPLLFEVAWEVCWQLGGIYTVLRTKAAATLKTWGDRYCLVGPYNPSTAALEFEPEEPSGPMAEVIRRLREQGIPAHYGYWLVNGHPHVILLDYRAKFRDLDADKYLMWADHGIAIPPNDGELNDVVAFGFACTELFRNLTAVVTDRPILGHFHEWMGGLAVPRIAHLRLPVATVFTTHATLLGRYLAGDNPDFYNHLPFLDPDAEARKYLIFPRHLIEKAAAHASTVFTTVSEVTAYEAEKLLGRRPECILPNGLNIQRFAALHEFQNLHRQYKEKIHEFVMGHFFPCYTFDLDRTIYLFTSGRYEYRNKGMDMFIEAMHRLNHRLRYVPDRPTVVAFIITKAAVRSPNVGALSNQMMFNELKGTCQALQEEMGQNLFLAAAQGRIPQGNELLTSDASIRLKRAMHAWRTGQPPIIVTHDLADDAGDPTLKHMRHRHLFNAADDPVKMIFHPQFLSTTGPFVNLDYEQFVRGCHMGIFPSYYEPWGYTPMECVALGVPTATTDLSGFGAYVRRHLTDSREKGICVLDRRYRSFDEACNQLVDYLFDFVRMSRRQRIELRNKVERLSELFDWTALIRHYREAHDTALERIGARRAGTLEIRMV